MISVVTTSGLVWLRHGLVLGMLFLPGIASVSTTFDKPADARNVATVAGGEPQPEVAFSIQKQGGGWWLASPEGRKFFSLGVCCVNRGESQKSFDPANPGYAAWQHYDTPAAWGGASLGRLKSWGFTTIGGWGDFATLRQLPEQTLYLTPVLHIGLTVGAPWWDMWEPRNVRRMEEIARDQILPLRGDPRLLGYYSDNELGWWNAALWKLTLEQPAASGQRQRLIQLLRDAYHNDWKKLSADFQSEGAQGWSQLQDHGILYLQPGGNGIRVMRRFLGLLADRYYQLMRDTIRKYDSRALYLGDRYQSFYYPEVARAAARYVDVISSNLDASWVDGTLARYYLETLHALTGKPILISEFYLAATENRSGNQNRPGVYPVVATQRQRADAARNTLVYFARLPYVVGADWFQFADEPEHGRADGENFNFGLVDIHDQPYEEITSMFATVNTEKLKIQSAPPRPDASSGVPPAPDDPFASFTPTRALSHWDRERGFVKPKSPNPSADLYVCWNAGALYLGLYGMDIVEADYYRNSLVPEKDRALWTVRINGREVVAARVGAGRAALAIARRARLETLNLATRNVTALELPANLLGKDRFQPGDTLELSCTLLTHARANRCDWKVRLTLREGVRTNDSISK